MNHLIATQFVTPSISGSSITGFTKGSVIFVGDNSLTEDNTNLFWDNNQKFMGFGTNTPSTNIQVYGVDPSITLTESTSGSSTTLTKTVSGNLATRTNNVLDYDEYTVLMIHSEETPGTVGLTDSSSKGHLIVSSATHESTTSKWGTTSVYSPNYKSTMQPSNDWAFGTGDFTIDFWGNIQSDGTIWDNNQYNLWIQFVGGKVRAYFSGPSDYTQETVGSVVAGTWYHFMITRENGIVRIFRNGVQTNVDYPNTTNITSVGGDGVAIGARYSGTGLLLNWYFEEFRVSKGIARESTDFTPPTGPQTKDTAIDFKVWESGENVMAFGDSRLPMQHKGLQIQYLPEDYNEEYMQIVDPEGEEVMVVDTLLGRVGINKSGTNIISDLEVGGEFAVSTVASGKTAWGKIFLSPYNYRYGVMDFVVDANSPPISDNFRFYGNESITTNWMLSKGNPSESTSRQISMTSSTNFCQITTTQQISTRHPVPLYFGGNQAAGAYATASFDFPNQRFSFGHIVPTCLMHLKSINNDEVVFTVQGATSQSENLIECKDVDDNVVMTVQPNGDLTLPSLSGQGIMVDTSSPDFGWRDLIGEIKTRPAAGGGAAAQPDYVAYRGSIYAYRFGTNAPNNHLHEAFAEYHLPHDYVPGSDLYIHVHWSQIVVDTGNGGSPGNSKWYFDVSYASGYDGDAFIAPITLSVVQTASTTQYSHMIAEVQLSTPSPTGSMLDSNDIEVDGLLLVRLYRDPTDVADTLDQDTFAHYIDIHYQTTGLMGTKDKNTPFYT